MKKNGFTLLEIVFTLSIFAGLVLVCSISASYLIGKNERQVLTDEIRTVVHYAKIQAVTLGHPVYLTPLDSSLNWSKGIILTELNNKTNKMELIHQWQWHHRHWSVTWSGVNSSNRITLSNNPMSAISNGKFILVNVRTKERTELILNRLGRIRIN